MYGISGIYIGAFIEIGASRIIIGRDANRCNLAIPGQRISRYHCVLWYESEKDMYAVVDVSANGIYIGEGERIAANERVYLPHNTLIYIATVENSFRLL